MGRSKKCECEEDDETGDEMHVRWVEKIVQQDPLEVMLYSRRALTNKQLGLSHTPGFDVPDKNREDLILLLSPSSCI